jgi:hypothetical protein
MPVGMCSDGSLSAWTLDWSAPLTNAREVRRRMRQHLDWLADPDLSRLWDAVALWVALTVADDDPCLSDNGGIRPFLTWP